MSYKLHSKLQNKKMYHQSTTTQISSTRHLVTCKVYTVYNDTSELEQDLSACTVDSPLAKARGLSSPCTVDNPLAKTRGLSPRRRD